MHRLMPGRADFVDACHIEGDGKWVMVWQSTPLPHTFYTESTVIIKNTCKAKVVEVR